MNAMLNVTNRALLSFLAVAMLVPTRSIHAQSALPQGDAKAKTAGGQDVHENIIYARPGGLALELDLILPKDAPAACPVVIVIHGTGITKGRMGVRKHAQALADSGFAAVAVGFRHQSNHPYPAALKDVDAAVDWIHANAAKYNLDKNRIGVLGFSGGGSLATLLGTQKPRRVSAVVSYFAPSDLAVLHENSRGISGFLIRTSLEQWLGDTPVRAPKQFKQASPITHVHKEMAPHLLIAGTADTVVPVEQCKLLAEKMTQSKAHVNLLTFENAPHNFDEENSLNAKLAFNATQIFLAEHLTHRRLNGAGAAESAKTK